MKSFNKTALIFVCLLTVLIVIVGLASAWWVKKEQTAQAPTASQSIQPSGPAVSLTPEQQAIQDSMTSALQHQDKQEYDQARADYERVIALNPNELAAYNNLAATYLNQEKWQEAIDPLKKAITIDKTYMAAHLNLGLAYCRVGDLKNAQAEYDVAKNIAQSDFLGNLIKEGCKK
jgi:tetratricopeptide (TPR) repeat protein